MPSRLRPRHQDPQRCTGRARPQSRCHRSMAPLCPRDGTRLAGLAGLGPPFRLQGGTMSGTPSPELQRARYAVGDALRRGDVATAMDLSDQAVSAGLEEVSLLTLAGQRRMSVGKPDIALGLLVRAREIAPANIEALNALGLCLAAIGRGRDALVIFDEAISHAPDTAYLYLH